MKKTSKEQKNKVKVTLPDVSIPLESVTIGQGGGVHSVKLGDEVNGMEVARITADPQIPNLFNCFNNDGYPILNVAPGSEPYTVCFKYDINAHDNLKQARAILRDIKAREAGYPLNEEDVEKLVLELTESQPLEKGEIEDLVNVNLNSKPPQPVESKAERIAWIKTCVETSINREVDPDKK